MKKLFFLTTALALVLGLSQCKKPNMPSINGSNGTQHVVLKASFDNGNTKIEQDGAGLKWKAGDIITVRKGGEALNPGTLTCTDEITGTFEGEIAETSGNITFTFGTPKVNYSEQTGAMNDALYLISPEIQYEPGGSYTATLNMPYAVLKLDLKALGTATRGNTVTITKVVSGETVTVATVENVTNAANNPYYVAMPAAENTEYTFSGNEKTVKKTWTLLENKFYTKDVNGNPSGEAIEIKPGSPLYLPGEFSVSTTKKVKFSRGNLYYEPSTSSFKMETNQWDYQSSYDFTTWGNNNHISHFYWSNTTDWKTAGMEPYAQTYSYSERSASDHFFTEASGFTVEGESGWYTLSKDEWSYLITTRGTNLRKRSKVTFDNEGTIKIEGLILMPDGWTGSLSDLTTYTVWQTLAAAGAVFIPAAGIRYATEIKEVGSSGYCWSSNPKNDDVTKAYRMYFNSIGITTNNVERYYGTPIRLVQ